MKLGGETGCLSCGHEKEAAAAWLHKTQENLNRMENFACIYRSNRTLRRRLNTNIRIKRIWIQLYYV